MTRVSSMLAVPAVAAVLALSLTACGGDDSGSSMPGHGSGGSAASSSAQQGGTHNDADVMFGQMMIPHHEQAITISKMAPSRASSAEVKTLATQIEQAQAPEIQKMTGWLKSWGAPTTSDMASMGHAMPGMVTDDNLKKLEKASGKEFDTMFLELMIEHHEGAISMAKTEQAQGGSAEAKALAASIVTSQSAEITKMRDMLKNA